MSDVSTPRVPTVLGQSVQRVRSHNLISAFPLVLPPSITEFVANAVGVPESSVSGFWTRLREDIWHLPEQTLSEHEEGLFREHGWKRGISNWPILLMWEIH